MKKKKILSVFSGWVVLNLAFFVFSLSSFPAEVTISVTVADTTPPAAVTNLTAAPGNNPNTVELIWSIPGDDGWEIPLSTGSMFKVQSSTFTEVVWSTTNAQVTISTSGVTPGTTVSTLITGLTEGGTYYFRLWTADEIPNWSEISIGATTWAQVDLIAPAAITDLLASCATDGTGKVTLTWTAPKEDSSTGGAVSSYDVRYATWDFTNYWDSGKQWTIGIPTGAAPGTPRGLTMMSLANDSTYYFIVKSTDNAGNISGESNLAYTYVLHIVISEVQIDGDHPAGSTKDEFIELYNPLSVDINIQTLGIYFHIRNSGGTDGNKTITLINFTIPAKGYFVIAGTSTAGSYNGQVVPDATYPVGSGNTLVENGSVYLSTTSTNFSDFPGPWGRAAIDLVGFGSQPSGGYETQTTTSPSANQSVERQAKGGLNPLPGQSGEFLGNAYDTNNNTNDFVIRTLSDPQNSSSSREPDTIAPAVVADLSAQPGPTGGTIKLTWSAPGDDGLLGNLVTGSQYKIFYSTSLSEAEASHYNMAQITVSTSGVSPGTLSTYQLSNLTTGGTYYLHLWTADEVPNWSGISNRATAYLEILSVSVDTTSLDFGIIAPDTNFNIANTSITITNSGNVNIALALSCSNSPDWTIVSSTPTNRTEFRLLGIFNTLQPQASDYEVNIDTITGTIQTASGIRYAGNQTGNNVPAGEKRNLWLCFSAPRSTPTNPTRTEQKFTVSITAEKPTQ